MNQDELYHYGVLGMKWGIRRYQNKDGSLTSEGAKRYQKSDNKVKNEKQKSERKTKSEEQVNSERQKRSDSKNRGTLSDDELRVKINRLKMERELRELTDKEVSPGKKFTYDIVSNVGKTVLTTALTGAALYAAYSVVSGEKVNRKDLGLTVAKGQFTQTEKKKSNEQKE